MTRDRGPWIAALLVSFALAGESASATARTPATSRPQCTAKFGTIRDERGQTTQIAWEPQDAAQVTGASLRLSKPVTLRSAPLPLEPLRLYDISATIARGPGTRTRFLLVYTDRRGQQQQWEPVWQYPKAPRPNWLPLSPSPQPYVQGFVLPPGARAPHFELTLLPAQEAKLAPYAFWQLAQLSVEDAGPVACCSHLGPNRLLGGDMVLQADDGLPLGWSPWERHASDEAGLVARPGSKTSHVLRIAQGVHAMFGTTVVEVTRGSAWRLSIRARGDGHIQLLAHSLSDDRRMPVRIADPQSTRIDVHTPVWKTFQALWFATAPAVHGAQVAIGATARHGLEIGAVEFRHYLY